jgi:hypothetical protein
MMDTEKQDMKIRSGFICLRIGTGGRSLSNEEFCKGMKYLGQLSDY